ncbi:MAG: winged helix-turn-helix transcriptional regulator [Methylobacteriaceae bacterium]|nr:winged helix-turn-helix transcriptional regulator [Methylobacteriaceae bacterium]
MKNEHTFEEFKRDFPPKNELKAEIVAFLNSRASDDEIKRMLISDVAHQYERQLTPYDTLDFSYVAKRLADRGIVFDDFGLEIRKPGGNYNNAGLILSASNPFVTKIAVFEGLKVDTFLDKKEYSGSIAEQIDKAMDYMKLVIRERVVITGSPQRTVLPDYPAKAVREAILNCYCHRDYTLSADIRVFVFDNRIEIYSPGGVPEGLSIEDILNGANAKRNPILVKALDKLDYIENYTSGIRRIIGEYEGFPLQPEFYASDALFKVTLFNKNHYYDQLKVMPHSSKNNGDEHAGVNGASNANAQEIVNHSGKATKNTIRNEILGLMRRDGTLTQVQLAELTGKHRVTIAKSMRALRAAGLIERVGSRKSGYWRILENRPSA